MSQLDELEFQPFVPPTLYSKYFDVMSKNENVYVCVVQDEKQSSSIYLERPPDAESGKEFLEGVLRVFFTADDIRKYGRSVAMAEGVDHSLVRKWEMKFSFFLDYISQLDARHKEAGKMGVRAVASAVHDGNFLNLDILWTAEQNCMV